MNGPAGGGTYSSGGFSMEDIFSQFGDIFGGHFGGGFGGFSGFGGFGGSAGGARRVNRGSDLRVKVRLTLKEIVNGTTKKLKISKFVVCDQCGGSGARTPSGVSKCKTCNGTGVVTEVVDSFFGRTQTQRACPTCQGSGEVITDPCPKCKGEGVVRGEEVVEIKIPAGVGEGMQLSVSGKGNAARRGGINGDLLVVIEEERDPQLVRDGNDLLHSHKISIPTAVLGGTIEVPTVEGRAKVKVAAGTKAGSVLRLRGKGIPDINGRGRGDILVVVDIDVRRNSLLRSGRRSNSLRRVRRSARPTTRGRNKIYSSACGISSDKEYICSVTAAFVHFRFRQRILERYGRALL